MNIVTEWVDNPENIFWIWNEKVSNHSSGRIYPAFTSNVASGKTVAVYQMMHGEKMKIAQLSVPDYQRIKEKYDTGEGIDLSYTYLDDFSWLGDAKPYEVEEEPNREMIFFRADASFWNGEAKKNEYMHLLHLDIQEDNLSFQYTGMNQINLDFTWINILGGNLDFSNARFYDSSIVSLMLNPFGNMYFPSEISFRYSHGDNVEIMIDMLRRTCTMDFLDARLNQSKVSIDGLPHNLNEICMTKAKLDSVSVTNAQIQSVDIIGASINVMKFARCKLNGIVNIDSAINVLHMEDCVISDVMKITLSSKTELAFDKTIISGKLYFRGFKENICSLIKQIRSKQWNNLDQLLVLKENFRQIGDYEMEDLCHLHYHREKNRAEKNVLKKAAGKLLDWVCGYGTAPYRLLLAITGVILLFSVIYCCVPFLQFQNVKRLIDYIYVSGITFFTVGYGDILPVNAITKIVVIIEAFLGVSMMSALLALLTRKVIR